MTIFERLVAMLRASDEKANSTKRFLLLYSGFFSLIAAFVLIGHLRSGASFVMNTNGWKQYLKALAYYGDWLRAVVGGGLWTSLDKLPTYSVSLGYGSDIIGTLHYSTIGDPLNLLAALVPHSTIPHLYALLIFVRLYLAGLVFGLFVRDVIDPMPSMRPSVAGALSYTFFAYSVSLSVSHPFFVNPMITFPLMVWGVRRMLTTGNGKRILFAGTLLATVSSVYFLLPQTLLLAGYVVWLVVFGDTHISKQARGLLEVGATFVLGVLCGAFVAYPALLAFVGAPTTGKAYTLLYSIRYYTNFFLGLSSIDSGLYSWAALGVSPAVLLAIVLLFMQREQHKGYKVLVVALVVLALVPFFGSVFNWGAYPTHRWTWAASLFGAYLLVFLWPELIDLSTDRRIVFVCIALGYYMLVSLVISASGLPSAGSITESFFGLVMTIALVTGAEHLEASVAQRGRLLFALIIAAIIGNVMVVYGRTYANYAAQFIPRTEVAAYEKTDAAALASLGDNNGFYRIGGDSPDANASLLAGTYGTDYHWTVTEPSLAEFREALNVNTSMQQEVNNLNRRSILQALLGMRYYVADKAIGLPEGYSFLPGSTKLINGRSGMIFKNDEVLSLGYAYDNAISREEFEALPVVDRQWALLQGVVLDEVPSELDKEAVKTSSVEVPYTVECGENVSYEDGCFTVEKANTTAVLNFEGIARSETYLCFKGFDYVFDNALSGRKFLSRIFSDPLLDASLVCRFGSDVDEGLAPTLAHHCKTQRYYEGRHDYALNAGYYVEPRTHVTITFPHTGFYRFDEMSIVCLPLAGMNEQLAQLAHNQLTDIDLHQPAGVSATNRITGRVEASGDEMLVITLPYAQGWTAYVDGQESPIQKANIAFMGIQLEQGSHEIELVYKTPGLATGRTVTLVGGALALAWACAGTVARKRKVA